MTKSQSKSKRPWVWVAAVAGLALVAAAVPNVPDINRYLKIRKM